LALVSVLPQIIVDAVLAKVNLGSGGFFEQGLDHFPGEVDTGGSVHNVHLVKSGSEIVLKESQNSLKSLHRKFNKCSLKMFKPQKEYL